MNGLGVKDIFGGWSSSRGPSSDWRRASRGVGRFGVILGPQFGAGAFMLRFILDTRFRLTRVDVAVMTETTNIRRENVVGRRK